MKIVRSLWKPVRIVADANILVRAATNPAGPAGALPDFVEGRVCRLITSEHILTTVADKLKLPRFQRRFAIPDQEIDAYCGALRHSSTHVTPAQGPPIVPGDPEDDLIVYTAVAGRAEVICTWDQHLYQPAVLAFCQRRSSRVCRDIDLLEDLRGG